MASAISTVPHLVTALSGPLQSFEKRIIDSIPQIERWFRVTLQDPTPPFYASIDLRNAGFKLAPVDTNLFPAGFNNLSKDMLSLGVQAVVHAIGQYCPQASGILLIPENHSRNKFYLESILSLTMILRQAGLQVRLGSFHPDIQAPVSIQVEENLFCVEPVIRKGNRVGLNDFDPCMILLNNDLSGGIPPILEGLNGQVLLPPLHAGWVVRKKTRHFTAYAKVAEKFAADLGIDPWLIEPYFDSAEHLDFQRPEDAERLSDKVCDLLNKVRRKYMDYKIDEKPYVVVKADAGTYGMGVMVVRDASEIRSLNRKQRNKMSVVKDGLAVSSVILQEGVPTIESVDGGAAEPVVYAMDRNVIGGFYRVHTERSRDQNLNAPGMHFVPLPFSTCCQFPDSHLPVEQPHNRFYVYGAVARLAIVAAAMELADTEPVTPVFNEIQLAMGG